MLCRPLALLFPLAGLACARLPSVPPLDPGAPVLFLRTEAQVSQPVNFTFVLYSSSWAIFSRRDGPVRRYLSAKLSPQELRMLRSEVGIDALAQLNSNYDLSPSAGDVPVRTLSAYPPLAKNYFAVVVRGPLGVLDGRPMTLDVAGPPEPFLRAYTYLTSCVFNEERDWVPDEIAIHLSTTEMESSDCVWPTQWTLHGGTDTARDPTVRRREKYSVTGVSLSEVQALISRCRGVVRIDQVFWDVFASATAPNLGP